MPPLDAYSHNKKLWLIQQHGRYQNEPSSKLRLPEGRVWRGFAKILVLIRVAFILVLMTVLRGNGVKSAPPMHPHQLLKRKPQVIRYPCTRCESGPPRSRLDFKTTKAEFITTKLCSVALDFCSFLMHNIREVNAMKINNLKQIREIYGATQEQIARALSVNRVTVANWENGSTTASSANREKMSIYYGVGPEFFYEQELTEQAKQAIRQTAEREQAVVSQSNGKDNKPEDFHELFETVSFSRVMQDYMITMKILLAKVDDADLDTLRTALTINQKMGRRLAAIVSLREEEERSGDVPLTELMGSVSE